MSDPSSLAPLLRYQCSHCATASDSRELIEVHAAALHAIRTHFSCDFCGVQMPEMADLIRHVIQTHFGNESLSYVTQGQQIRIQGSGTTAEQQVELLPLEQDFRLSPQDLDKNNTFEDCYPPPKLNIQPLDTTSSPQVAGDFKSPSPDSTEKTVTSCPSQPVAPVSEDLSSATLNTPEIVANLTPDVIVRSGSSQSLIPGMSGGARILGTAPLTSSFSSSGGKGIAVLGLAAKSGTLSSGLATNPPINDINNNNTKSFQLVLPRGCSVLSKGQVQRLLTDGGGVGLLQASKPAKASLFQTFKSEPVTISHDCYECQPCFLGGMLAAWLTWH